MSSARACFDCKKSVCNPSFPRANRAIDDPAIVGRLESPSHSVFQAQGQIGYLRISLIGKIYVCALI